MSSLNASRITTWSILKRSWFVESFVLTNVSLPFNHCFIPLSVYHLITRLQDRAEHCYFGVTPGGYLDVPSMEHTKKIRPRGTYIDGWVFVHTWSFLLVSMIYDMYKYFLYFWNFLEKERNLHILLWRIDILHGCHCDISFFEVADKSSQFLYRFLSSFNIVYKSLCTIYLVLFSTIICLLCLIYCKFFDLNAIIKSFLLPLIWLHYIFVYKGGILPTRNFLHRGPHFPRQSISWGIKHSSNLLVPVPLLLLPCDFKNSHFNLLLNIFQ